MEAGSVVVVVVVVAVKQVASVVDGDVEGGIVVAVGVENGSSEARASRGPQFLNLSRERVALELRMSDTE